MDTDGSKKFQSPYVIGDSESGGDFRESSLNIKRRNSLNVTIKTVDDDFPEDDCLSPEKDADILEAPSAFREKIIGTVLALICSLFYSTEYALASKLRRIFVTEVVLGFLVMILICTLPLVLWKRTFWEQFKSNAWLMILFGCIATVKTILLNISVSELPLGDAISIFYSSPVFVVILARIFLGEKITIFKGCFVIVVIVGVILVVHPPVLFSLLLDNEESEDISVKGYICAFATSILTACEGITLRKLKAVAFYNNLLIFVVIGTLVTYATFPFVNLTMPNITLEWIMWPLAGFCLFAGVAFLNLALQKQEASVVSVIRCFEVIVTYGIQIFGFGKPAKWMTFLGAAVILSSAMSIALEKSIKRMYRRCCRKKVRPALQEVSVSINERRASITATVRRMSIATRPSGMSDFPKPSMRRKSSPNISNGSTDSDFVM